MQSVKIGERVQVGTGQPLLLIAGPCQIESLEHSQRIAEFLVQVCKKYPVQLVFKSSFDKANRTSLSGQRGVGIDEGLRILENIRSSFGIPVLTDVHDLDQAKSAGAVVDTIQIPAFLCRQTDLLIAAGKYGKSVNIKKGQFLHPSDMSHVAAKVASTGNNNILLCERGASFGYRDLVVDMRSLVLMQQAGYPIIYDATHSVQQMGGAAGHSGGSREFIEALARGAVAVGVDGVFFECHNDPDKAPSDAACMLPLERVEPLIASLCRIKEAAVKSIS